MYFYVHLSEDEKEQAQAQDDPRDEDEDVNEDKYTGFRSPQLYNDDVSKKFSILKGQLWKLQG